MKNKIIFEKTYSDLELCEIDSDTYHCFDPDHNEIVSYLPRDEFGFVKGRFKLTIEFVEE